MASVRRQRHISDAAKQLSILALHRLFPILATNRRCCSHLREVFAAFFIGLV